MQMPQIELIPLQAALSLDSDCTLDVLVKISLPTAKVALERPPVNLALVIDRSSSMRGDKIQLARQIACYAVQQLLPTDRLSITVFDREVRNLVPSKLATDKANIIRQIQQIEPGVGTALHTGWLTGGMQVIKHFHSQHLNHVILITDGFVSLGEKNIDEIVNDVDGLSRRGVTTTTIGVGNVCEENLMLAIACNGEGHYYYVESSQQLEHIFQTELQDLMATVGHSVNIGVEPQGDVEIEDVFNDLEVDRCGRFQLPNLVIGNTIELLVRLRVPPMSEATVLSNFRLSWVSPRHNERYKLQAKLILPVLRASQLAEFPPNPEVQNQLALMIAARAKKDAVKKLDRGDYDAASQLLKDARKLLLNAPGYDLMEREAEALADLDDNLQMLRLQKLRKKPIYQTYDRQFSCYPLLDFLDER